jgi:hypothetical protein
MPKRPVKDRDFAVNAFRVVEQAIGEHMDGTPLPSESTPKPKSAAINGRLGGLKGGAARATKLTPTERKSIAVKAAQARWGRPIPNKH